jgi:hypothetical protein
MKLTKNGLTKYNRAIAAVALAAVSAGYTAAQVTSTRHIEVTVTEPSGRFVTGLQREDFEITENGVRRAITRFTAASSMVDRDGAAKPPAEIRNQYQVEFESDTPSSKVEVVVRERPGLPRLKVNWR